MFRTGILYLNCPMEPDILMRDSELAQRHPSLIISNRLRGVSYQGFTLFLLQMLF